MMLYPAMTKLTEYIPNRYMMVNVVARLRPSDRPGGGDEWGDLEEKPVTMAINEVAEGLFDASTINTVIDTDK